MELIISSIAGDLTSRLISFLMNKFSDHLCSEEKVNRLEQLLLRVHMVIEEADGRYITNSCMLAHLKRIVAAMYSGYHVLDTIKYLKNKEGTNDLVNDSSALSFATPLKRSRYTSVCTERKKIFGMELQGALENLETVIGDISEFVILLAGCERMTHKPYDTYIYIDNFMFGRHVEKQHLIRFLLDNNTNGPPAVIPVIGGRGVGKRTLVAHVCNDERVRSHFYFILHINGDNLGGITENNNLPARTLVIVEFDSDVDDNDWKTFYSSLTSLYRGNKVIILTRIKKLERFGTVKPITLDRMVHEEYRYLLKTLAFGSADPMDHPQLVSIVEEFALLLGGRLIPANIIGYILRKNLNVHFWLARLKGVRFTVKKNMSMSGSHPNELFDQGHPAHLTDYLLYPASTTTNSPKNDLPKLTFGDILTCQNFPPKGDFNLVSWESRIPPYTSFVHMFCSRSTGITLVREEASKATFLKKKNRTEFAAVELQPPPPPSSCRHRLSRPDPARKGSGVATLVELRRRRHSPLPPKVRSGEPQDMEVAVSAVTGELFSRFISFLLSKYSSHEISEEKQLERLQQLLLRVCTVVEEADGRYITNSGMLMQLKGLADAMYRGHHVLDMFKCRSLIQENSIKEVSNPFSPLKRFRTIVDAAGHDKARYLELHRTLGMLETAVDHMAEFAVLLGGCERMSRRPYDAYLYIDNFMLGRHTEKQRLLNFLLEYNPPGLPAVLPIVGGLAVGKKTLVAHVCADERVQSQFSSILHLNEDDLLRIAHSDTLLSGKMLVVVEFVSDLNEKNWEEFYSSLAQMKEGSKVITISRFRKSEKLGTVKPILLDIHSYGELSYLFKTLAFGSANPKDHPRLLQIAEEFAMQLQLRGSLVAANIFADVLRRNLDVNFWLCMLNRCITVAERNFSLYGKHVRLLFEQGHRVDITNFASSPAAPLHIIPFTGLNSALKDMQRVTFRELLLDPSVRPKGEFNLVSWESRLPPYTSFIHFVPNYAQDFPKDTPLSGRKRRGIPS
uniref:Disease resistance N-terminal domain-containing protein n=1 Tax=Oryza punctata TaxID=4537 RepID=A0A0E0M5A1_ORYPU